MEFWGEKPIDLVKDANIFPDTIQPYNDRMNTLTRLVIFIAIVLFLCKKKELAVYVLIFGIILIFILFYSKKDISKDNFGIQKMTSIPTSLQNKDYTSTFDPQVLRDFFPINSDLVPQEFPGTSRVPTMNEPNVGSLWYSTKHGPPRHREPPVIPIRSDDAKSWGGYMTNINEKRPQLLRENFEFGNQFPQEMSRNISWNKEAREKQNFSMERQDTNYNDLYGDVAKSKSASREQLPQGISMLHNQRLPENMMLGGNRADVPKMNTQLPGNLNVNGKDERWDGNDYYIYRRSVSDPDNHHNYVQPINQANGVAYMPSRIDQFGDYDQEHSGFGQTQGFPTVYPSEHFVRDHVSHSERLNQPNRSSNSARNSAYRVIPSLTVGDQLYNPQRESFGDEYRSYEDVNTGQMGFYYTNTDPFSGPNFIMRSNVNHADYINPNGQIIPKYLRENVVSEDFVAEVRNQQLGDELYHRDSMQGNIQAKFAERDWQMRLAPIRGFAGQSKW